MQALRANRDLPGRPFPLRGRGVGAANYPGRELPNSYADNQNLPSVIFPPCAKGGYEEENDHRIQKMEGTKFVILRHQTFNEAQVTSDSAYGANKESLSAFVEDFETSISIDFPEDEEYVGEVLDCGSSDISVHGRTEEAQHADEKDDRNSSIPEVVITQADEVGDRQYLI
ncbi:dolichyldiphosphatase 1 [Platysternon megacephalum]|uniref:Dolichyldiphosphatase 1 n=1 Tax=Platysternon megacephalum TaxID=55544 RepID=A0A4D9EJ63_9SAUR|nr:dolichyldiphosphatase 1 [Platysternon megacephalum]